MAGGEWYGWDGGNVWGGGGYRMADMYGDWGGRYERGYNLRHNFQNGGRYK